MAPSSDHNLQRPPLRVLLLIDGLGWGGAEMLLPELIGAARIAGVEFSVAYLREKDGSPAAARIRELGIDPVGLDIGGLLHPESLRRVRRHVAACAPDVVHTHLGYSDFLGGLAAGTLGVPAVSTIHISVWSRTSRDRVKAFLFDRVRRAATSRVIAVSKAARAVYLGHGWGPRDRVVVVHNGIDGTARPGAGPDVRSSLGLEPDDLVVGMLSVLRPGKGHEIAVDAVADLLPSFPRLRLLVVGDGPSRADVEKLVSGLGSRAVLAGHRDDVMEVLDAVDILVHPSHHDAFPTALIEAMAAGIPVVATAVGGIPEIVVDGVTGTLVPDPPRAVAVADALRPLLSSDATRAEAGRAGRRRFEEEFAAGRWAERMRALYEEVAAERPMPLQRLARRRRGRVVTTDATPGRR